MYCTLLIILSVVYFCQLLGIILALPVFDGLGSSVGQWFYFTDCFVSHLLLSVTLRYSLHCGYWTVLGPQWASNDLGAMAVSS